MAIQNRYSGIHSTNSPIRTAFEIDRNDNKDLPEITRGLMVATAGDVRVRFEDGSEATLPELRPGVIYPVAVARVLFTGTEADGIVGLV